MKNIKVILLVIAGLLLAVLLTLLLAPRGGSRYGQSPSAPAPVPVEVRPPSPAPRRVKIVDRAREHPGVEKLPAKRRKLRVSSLRDPGEAMGGGARLDLPEKTTGQLQKK